MKEIKISFAVMMHPSRKKFIPYLKEKLGDVPISMDRGISIWDTSKRAWLEYDKTATHHCVIQDDAIISSNFNNRISEFVNSENYAFNLYLGNRRSKELRRKAQESMKTGRLVLDWLCWGVGICLPTKIITDMVKYGDKLNNMHKHDDTIIGRYLRKIGMKTCYAVPSLVDHRQGKSLIGDGSKRKAMHFIDNINIPKVIHQIWVGDKPVPEKWTKTWKEKNPTFEYKLWREKDIEEMGLQNKAFYNRYKRSKVYHGMSDVARIEILYNYGGIYIDADTECLESLDGADFMGGKFFAVYANSKPLARIANGVIGATKGHKIMEDYIKRMGIVKKITPCWKTIGGTLFTKVINDNKGDGINILPPHTFYPESMWGKIKYKGTDKVYARHYWGSTKKLY